MKIICLGDSLTYGLGIPTEKNWVSLLEKKTGHQIINKGISGDTSGGMLARLERDVLSLEPDMLFLMTGSNDFIMGCDASVVRANIMAIVHQTRAAKIRVTLCTSINGDSENVRKEWEQLSDFQEVDQKKSELCEWMKCFCEAFKLPCVNLHNLFEEIVAGQKTEYFFDGVHPNQRGHLLISDIITQSGVIH